MKQPSKHILILSGIGVVAIAVLIISFQIYATTLSFYCNSCHSMKPFYKSWQNSTHARQKCIDCHIEPGVENTVFFTLRVINPVYTAGLSKPKGVNKPSNKTCLKCHTQERTISPTGILVIPHELHVKQEKLNCVDCHEFLVHYPNSKGLNTPTMVSCMNDCHDGNEASKDCLICHPKGSSPSTHAAADWIDIHEREYKKNEAECSKCHNNCNRCHKLRPKSHTDKWKFSPHAEQAGSLDSKSCGTCHDQKLCSECHQKHPLDWEQTHYKPILENSAKPCYKCHESASFCNKCHSYMEESRQ